MMEIIDTDSSQTTDNKKLQPLPQNIFHVQKKSGESVLFDESKLKRSVVNALRDAGIEDNPISNQLVDEVISKLGEELNFKDGITTLDIREAVEIALLERGLTNAAQKYHDYQADWPPAVEVDDFFDSPAGAENITAVNQEKTPLSEPLAPLEVEDMIEPPELESGFDQEPKNSFQPAAAESERSRKKLPDDRAAFIHKFSLTDFSGYLTVNLFTDQSPGEIWIFLDKKPNQASQRLIDLFTKLVNVGLKNGFSLSKLLTNQTHEQLDLRLEQDFAPEPTVELLDHLQDWLINKFK